MSIFGRNLSGDSAKTANGCSSGSASVYATPSCKEAETPRLSAELDDISTRQLQNDISSTGDKERQEDESSRGCDETATTDSSSDVCTIPHSCLIGPPRKSQQLTVLICGFVAIFQTFGLTQAYGIFQTFHTQNLGDPRAMLPDHHARQRANIALIGTLSGAGLGYLLGVCMTPALKSRRTIQWRLGELSNVSYLAASGATMLFLGYLGASFSSSLAHLFLTQGIIVGVGGSLLCYPIVTISPEYFSRRQALAMGFITAGSGVGGLFYAPILSLLTQSIGIRWTLRILAFVNLTVGLILAALTPPPRRSVHKRRFLPRKLLRDPLLYIMVIAGLVGSMGLNSPLAFGPDFGRAVGLDAKTSANALAVINAVGSPSRIILGFLGDAYGRQNMQIVAGIVSTMSVFALWLVAAKESIKALWWIFNVVYGGLGGAWGLFLSPILIDVFGTDVFFGAIAIVNVARGVGSLAGPPLGAALLGTPTKGADAAENFASLAVFTGVLMFVATACAIVVRILHGGRNGGSWRA